MKIASFNINGVKARIGALTGWLAGADADVVVKASGVGVFDDELIAGVMQRAHPDALRIFWDVDAAATLDEMRADPAHALGGASQCTDSSTCLLWSTSRL